MSVFLDANILLESVLKDRRYVLKAQQYISFHNIIFSPLTAHLFVYFGKKDGLELGFLLDLLVKHNYTDFGVAEVMWAIKNVQHDDFEDALQVACAVLNGCDEFVTFDRHLAGNYRQFIKITVPK